MWAVILTFLKNYYPIVLIVAAYVIVIALMHSSYREGYNVCEQEWQEKERLSQYDRLKEIRAIEIRERERQAGIVREYQAKLTALEAAQKGQIDKVLDSDATAIRNVSDSVCAVQSQSERMHSNSNDNNKQHDRRGLSAKTNNRSGTVCYTEQQLRRQIAESVAIGQECDREMKRFKALIEVCKQQ